MLRWRVTVRYKIGRERPSAAREAAVQYGPSADAPPQTPEVYHVTVTDRGRLVLPVEIRKKLKIRDGDRVAVAVEADGSVSVTTRDVAIGMLRGMFKHLNKPGDPRASDRLIAERRREARMEEREFRERSERLKRMARKHRRG